MSGHSKWAQIKRQKATTDAKKSAEFGKFARLIAVEVRNAKGDVNSATVRAVIDRAKAAGLPKDNIERAVAKGAGSGAEALEQITYEMYGPGGVAILIETFTDSRNRTNQELKHLVSELGLALATPGAAAWAFVKGAEGGVTAQSTIPLSEEDEGKLAELVEKLEAQNDVENVYTNAA